MGRFDGNILKMRLRTRECECDIEPTIATASKPQGYEVLPILYWDGIGKHREVEYHCWIVERCIPLNQVAKLSTCNKNACVLAACRCIARLALCRIHLSDCHYYNLGLRITSSASEHEVLAIDAGSKDLAEFV